MLGRRSPQWQSVAAQGWPHPVPADSFYGRMAAVHEELFPDEDLAEMYCPDNGRPSLPPSLMSGVTLLQFYDGVSDQEAAARVKYDLRWKVALQLPLEYPGFAPSSLSVFRSRLLEHGQERYAFDRFIQVGREAGFLPSKVQELIDSAALHGAGAVQDTYTLIRKGLRRLLKALGYQVPAKRRGLAANLAVYLDQDRKADIDWADPQARAAQLQVLVRDAEAVLALAAEQADDAEVRQIGWLLTKILGDDIVPNEQGTPQLGQGVAEDRFISWTDPEMRHGRKSAARRWDGAKVHVVEEPTSELITEIDVGAANAGDGASLLPLVASVETHHGLVVEQVIGDHAYGSGDNRAACAPHDPPIDLVAPRGVPADPAVDKAAFTIDVTAHEATCPQGQITRAFRAVKDAQGRPVQQCVFDRAVCEQCPLFARCVRSKTQGRTVTTHSHEALLQAARHRETTPEFDRLYRLRPRIERKIAELVGHGLRQARYRGQRKKRLQALWTAAAVNLKRLFKLAASDLARLQRALVALNRPAGAVRPA